MDDKFSKAVIDSTVQLSLTVPIYSIQYNDICIITAFNEETQTPFSPFINNNNNNKVVIVSHYIKEDESFIAVNRKSVNINSLDSSKGAIAMETNARPLPLQIARYLISCHCCYGNSIQWQQLPTLWLLCENNDQGIFAIGVDSNGEVYQLQQNKSIIIKNNKTFSIHPNNLLPAKYQLMTTPTYNIYSRYEFGPTTEGEYSSHIALEFRWKNDTPTITPPPLTSLLDVTLSLSNKPGYTFSPLLSVYNEILYLVHLTEVAMETRAWSSLYDNNESILECNTVLSRIQSFLNEYTVNTNSVLDASTDNIVSPSVTMSLYQPRNDVDFLDKLWTICYTSVINDSQELMSCFGNVFMSVLKGRVQPFIHRTNKSTCATLLSQALSVATSNNDKRQVIASKLQALLTPEKCLATLIEIGIEKLEKDYITYFTSNGLASDNDIEQFLTLSITPFHDDALYQRVRLLLSLHCVLELITDLMTYLSLSQSILTTFVKKTLYYYKNNPLLTFDLLTTPTFTLSFKGSTDIKPLAVFSSLLSPSLLTCSTLDNKDTRQAFVSIAQPLFKYLPNQQQGQKKGREDDASHYSMDTYSAIAVKIN